MRNKGPRTKGWQTRRYAEGELPADFAGDGNIGLLLGEPSGDLIDVDLDCPEAIELADQHLPSTEAITGRPGAKSSHRFYRATGVQTKRFKDPANDSVTVEIRGKGAQTLVGPSVHPTGEPYDMLESEPAEVDGDRLTAAVEALHEAVLRARHGGASDCQDEQSSAACLPTEALDGSQGDDSEADRYAADAEELWRADRYVKAMPPSVSGHGGHARLYAAATALVHGFEVDPELALQVLIHDFNPRCEPPWSVQELRHKVDDAATKPHDRPRGWLLHAKWQRSGASAEASSGGSEAQRPTIEITTEEHEVADQTIKALSADASLYYRGGQLVRVGCDRGTDSGPRIDTVPSADLRDRMTRHARFATHSKRGMAQAHPPKWLVEAVAARGVWPGLRELSGISSIPVLRPDGTIHQVAGYDERSGMLHWSEVSFPTVKPELTHDDARAAVGALLEVVQDFPFASEAFRSAWLAALLTLVGRRAFEGPAPLFLIDGNAAGVGKTLLVRIIARLVTGRDAPAGCAPGGVEEMRKKITSIAIAGEPLALLDNVRDGLDNSALEAALTTTVWSDRRLGSNSMVELPLSTVWFATGNNMRVGGDLPRRTIPIRLKCVEERPEERSGFAHPNLLDWVAHERGRLVAAALTVLAAFLRAGRPSQSLAAMGGFEGWTGLIRNALVWAGQPDPALERARFARASDAELDRLEGIMNTWHAYLGEDGTTVASLVERLYDIHADLPAAACLRRELEAWSVGGPIDSRSLGNRLRSVRGRRVAGRCFEQIDKRQNAAVWALRVGQG